MSLKRGSVSPERLKDLRKKGRVYTISFCGKDDCSCGKAEELCSRGFFSLFIQAVYGIAFAQKNGIPYYVDFGSRKCQYSDPAKEDQNFWNYYFRQPLSHYKEAGKSIPGLNIEVHPLRIWSRKHFLQMHREVVSKLHFSRDVKGILEAKEIIFSRKKVLGVQIRCTDHASEIQPIRLENILKTISGKIEKFDKLFVATDDKRVLLLLKERYGTKLISNQAIRSENEEAVHSNKSIKDRHKLGLEVLVDCYCLSLCREAILLHSNISYAALLFNPGLSYTLLERAKERRKRLTTHLLYYLNEFGIRKW